MMKSILVSLVAVLAFIAVTSVVSADVASIDLVLVNELDVSTGNVAVEAGETITVEIFFTADANLTGGEAGDVEISAWIQGHRSNGVEEEFGDLLENMKYHKKLTLKIPSDLDETEETLTLYVRIETDAGNVEESYVLNAQREPFNSGILFVEVDNRIEAGSNVPVDIVIKNLGRHELEDLIVSVSIPELGLQKRAYFGDLTPTDNEDVFGEDAEDATERRIYLKIPTNVKSGSYELVVEAYNSDTKNIVKRTVEVVGVEVESKIFVPVMSKEISAGETATYTLTIVNSGNKIGVYEIIPETAEGVIVSVTEPIVTVKAGESKTVEIQVKAGSKEGTYSFGVNVNSEGKLLQRVVLNAAVTKGAVVRSNLTILTVILAIIFVVLLIVLVVLLTRKPTRTELEESYY